LLGAQDASTPGPHLLGLPPIPIPADNPQTPEKVAIGKKIFCDQRLSADGTISCASCHKASKAFTDGLSVAEGIGKHKGTRNTPTIINAVFQKSQFWDGRRASLEEQAQDPFVNAVVEHGVSSRSKNRSLSGRNDVS
jgi:cytochrome c peroxidase